ncbi:zinc finger and BTB domain-containing protein 20-like [Culicoides brevitarsis]|uniref:zinc finger and BTB domain-containing protein 20-like n=1 Tax=Culicoides brevitarsis TaxID=469753 RepID=UPI00307B2911
MDINYNESLFPKPVCIACLEFNIKLTKDDEIFSIFKDLLGGQFPANIQEENAQFCINCILQLKRIQVFKDRALTMHATVGKLIKIHSPVEMKAQNDSFTKSQSASGTPFKGYAVYERIQTRSARRRDSTNDVPMVEIPLKTTEKSDWRQNYAEILRNQPIVALKKVSPNKSALPDLMLRTPTPTKASLKDHSLPRGYSSTPRLPKNPPSLQRSSSTIVPPNPDSYCSECRLYVDLKDMTKHIMNSHFHKTKAGIFHCHVCQKTMRSQSSAVRHFQIHRSYEKVRKCQECHLAFAKITQFSYHFKTFHIKSHSCDYCSEKFSRKFEWQNHVAQCHPENIQCLHCGEVLDDQTAYYEHISIHPNYPKARNSSPESLSMPSVMNYPDEEASFNGFQQGNNTSLLSEDELEQFSIPLFGNEVDPIPID